jgi:ferritin
MSRSGTDTAVKMIGDQLEAAINEQIGREFAASLQYVAIAGYFDGESLPVLAQFFYRQADEEKEHAMRFVHYLVETGGQLQIPAIPATASSFSSAEEAVAAALGWEREVTAQIGDLMGIAVDSRDFLAQDFLRWFVTEQLEEVTTMATLLDMVRRAGPSGMFHVEAYLARSPSPHPEE